MGGLLARIRREAPLAVLDLTVALAAYLVTLVLRFDGSVPSAYWGNFWAFVSAALIGHLTMNQLCGLYGPMWRYASVLEAGLRTIAQRRVVPRPFSPHYLDVFVSRCGHHYIFYVHPEGQKPRIFAVLHENMNLLVRLAERLTP